MKQKIGLLVCGSNASNMNREKSRSWNSIITSLANGVERQVALIKKLEINFMEGYHNECARNTQKNRRKTEVRK